MNRPEPHDPPIFYNHIEGISALQAMAMGVAGELQQKLALEYITYILAGSYEASFFGEDTHKTAFAEGRRYVGQQIRHSLNLNVSVLIAAKAIVDKANSGELHANRSESVKAAEDLPTQAEMDQDERKAAKQRKAAAPKKPPVRKASTAKKPAVKLKSAAEKIKPRARNVSTKPRGPKRKPINP